MELITVSQHQNPFAWYNFCLVPRSYVMPSNKKYVTSKARTAWKVIFSTM